MELSFTDMVAFGNAYETANSYFYRPPAVHANNVAVTSALVADALRRMKSAIEGSGWVQGSIGAPGFGFCMQGAFFYRNGNKATVYDHMSPLGLVTAATLTMAIKARGLDYPGQLDDWNQVITFNDTPGRNKEEVLAVIEDAIAAMTTEAEPVPAPELVESEPPLVPDFVPGEFLGQLQLQLTGVGV